MRKIGRASILFAGAFLLVFLSPAVFGAETESAKKTIPPDSESEYEESLFWLKEESPFEDEKKLAIPPDSESEYEDSLFWIGEEREVETPAAEPEEANGKGPDKALQDLKRRQLEEQQQRLQRTIAEEAQQ